MKIVIATKNKQPALLGAIFGKSSGQPISPKLVVQGGSWMFDAGPLSNLVTRLSNRRLDNSTSNEGFRIVRKK